MFANLGRDNRMLLLSLGVWALGEGLWYNLRPIFIEELGATPAQVGLTLAIGGAARVIFLIPGGWLADRYGPRSVMLASWAMGIAAAVVMGLAPDWRWMILGEFLYGASIFVLPALSSYVLLALPRDQEETNVERALASIFAAYSVGLIFSQPVGGQIADHFGIRSTFWIGLVLFLLSTLVMLRTRPYMSPRGEAGDDWRALLYDRPFVALVALAFVVVLSITLGWPLAPIFLHDVRGFSLGWIGFFAALFALGTIIWNLSLGRMHPRRGLPLAMGVVWLSMLTLRQSGVVPGVSAAYLMMGAILTARSLINAAVARRVTRAQRAMAFGITEVSMSMAMAVAPRIAGSLYEIRSDLPFTVSLAVIPPVAVGAIITLRVFRRRVATLVMPRPRRTSM